MPQTTPSPTIALKTLSAAAIAFGLIAAAPAVAQARPCASTDLIGTWQLSSIRAAEPGVQEFYARAPVEYMRFGAGGRYIYVARTQPLKNVLEVNATLDRVDASDGRDYVARITRPGQLVVFQGQQPFQAFTCAMRKDGAMVWTEYPGMPDLERVHRRMR